MCDSELSHKLVLACVLLVHLSGTYSYASGVEIECIPLKSCPTALKLVLTKEYAPETIEFLKISHCGFDERSQPKVWCSKLNFCVTPQNKNGTCTPLQKCKSFQKLIASTDASNPQAQVFLNKFRCHEILEEPHVCCQDEPFLSNDGSTNYRTSRRQVDVREHPVVHDRSFYPDYDYYDWHGAGPPHYPSYHDYYDTFQPHHQILPENKNGHKNADYPFDPSFDKRNNRWNSHHHSPESPHTTQRAQNYHKNYDNSYDNHDVSNNNNKRGTNQNGNQGNFEMTNKNAEHPVSRRPDSKYDQTTSRNKSKDKSSSDHTTERISRKETTSRAINRGSMNKNNHNNERRKPPQKPTNTSNRVTSTENPTRKKWATSQQTTPPSRKTTSYVRTTTKKEDETIGEGDIIFEDDFLERKSKGKTEQTTKSSSRRRSNEEGSTKSCKTPDSKPGICTRPNTCSRFTTLQKNLDKSKKSVRDYLSKFTCDANGNICCEQNEDKAIDNSVFSAERTNENVPESLSKICGRQSGSNDRIVGGSVAELGEFPWLALLQYPSNKGIQQGCGGSLINSRYVVTAAHCVDEQILRTRGLGQVRQVVLGEYDTRNKTDCIYMLQGQDCADPPRTYRVESIVPHKQYTSKTVRHDIALLRLDREVTFSDYVKPICLPTKTSTLKGNETFIIAGWGKTSSAESSPILRKAKMPYIDRRRCSRGNRTVADGQICAGAGNGTDSCNGDSGGPLMLIVNFNFEFVTHLVGVISFGWSQCGKGPSVNTYVPFYIDWINENMKL